MNKLHIPIVIGADHRGYKLKQYIVTQMVTTRIGTFIWKDVGAHTNKRSDYPCYAHAAIQYMQQESIQYGVLLCGTGAGMAITANRYPGIYAAVCWNKKIAQLSKEDDNANILVIPADYITRNMAQHMIIAWMGATFKEGRYQTRLQEIDYR